ncbi:MULTISPECIES: 3'-5' exoribonuclease YhaM family protein [Crateriforma]|uniref:3'-5' exoribonuclease YhaM n=1 Tax=Crateriforma conspicua TaxID=2527996 RepID=A0A5C6FPX5_9PLAN|nr:MULTISPECIES: HD domain-containing protein [Crateriforma]TWU65172.1 3'-5' exoribonuclease YhaM [Crateriforma conspicua]
MTSTAPRIAINQLADGQTVAQAFRVADKQIRVNRQGGKYLFLRLADRTGKIVGMMWNVDERVADSFDRADYIHTEGRTQVHNGALQVIVTRLERMDPSEVDPADFEQFDAEQSQRLMARLTEQLGSIEDPQLSRLAQCYLNDGDLMNQLASAAAAVVHHHAFPGGLLRHTVDLMELADFVGNRYESIDRDLLLMGAFLHDLGKMHELSSDGELSYTDRGQMVGHIVIGIQMLGDKIQQIDTPETPFPVDLRYQLEHLIVSHHGEFEYGSPRLPSTMEAVALHHIDNLDAKISSFASVIEQDVSADPRWTNYNPSIGRKLWKK